MGGRYFLLALSMVLVGATVVIAKVLTDELPVFVLGALRCLIATMALLPLAYSGLVQTQKPSTDLFSPILGQAVFGVLFFTSFLFYGVRHTSALNAGIVTSALPAAVAVLSVIWLKERLGSVRAVAIAFAIFGIVILNLQSVEGGGTASWLGNGLILLAVLSEAAYTIFAKQSAERTGVILTAFWVNAVGLALFLPMALWQGVHVVWLSVPFSTWALLVTYALSSSVFALLLFYRGVQDIPANVAGLFTGFLPLTAGAVAIVFLGERLTLAHGIGTVLVLTGIWLATRKAVDGAQNHVK